MRATKLLPGLSLLLATACGSEPSPVVVGHVDDGSLSRALVAADHRHDDDEIRAIELRINGDTRRIRVDDDNTFVLRDLSAGDIEIGVEDDTFEGTLVIKDAAPGEVIDLLVRLDDDRLTLSVERRSKRQPERLPEGAIEITANNVIYQLDAREYDNDLVIRGNNVTVVGPFDDDCNPDAMAVLDGDLVVRGNNAQVFDLVVKGQTEIRGNNAHVRNLCD